GIRNCYHVPSFFTEDVVVKYFYLKNQIKAFEDFELIHTKLVNMVIRFALVHYA
ncbi:9694_t:CDS:1, partial [Scutellospora calospora]